MTGDTAPVLFSTLLKLLIGSFPHSGQDSPPLYGDYEAQRHWMEITTNLPLSQWYEHTEDNDLMYWGLDYPPLTAYFSYVIGCLMWIVDESSMWLFSSRGYVTPLTKLAMRFSVLLSDLLLISAITTFARIIYPKQDNSKRRLYLLFMIQPALLIIDHGHFQYNNCSLGLIMWAINAVLQNHFVMGSVIYTLAVQYKIISLYFAPAFFCYFIGVAFHTSSKITALRQTIIVMVAVTITILICWAPFLLHGEETAIQALRRCFPVNRGLYEDKVANFWCTISPIFKLKQWPVSSSFRFCLIATALSLLPTCVRLLYTEKSHRRLLLGLTSVSLSYFLFSFHVHEKTILFPLLPATLLGLEYPVMSFVMNCTALWSMYPLLSREGLTIPYFMLWILLCLCSDLKSIGRTKTCFFIYVSQVGMITIHALEMLAPSNWFLKYPDIFPYIMTSYCCAHFLLIFLRVNRDIWNSIPAPRKEVDERM